MGIFHIVIINSIYQMNSFGNWIVAVLVYLPVIWLCILNQSWPSFKCWAYYIRHAIVESLTRSSTPLDYHSKFLPEKRMDVCFLRLSKLLQGKIETYLSHSILNEHMPNQHGFIIVILIWTRHVIFSRFAWKGMLHISLVLANLTAYLPSYLQTYSNIQLFSIYHYFSPI